MNKYGLWLSRRKLGSGREQQQHQVTSKTVVVEDKPPARPSMTEQQLTDPTMIQVITQLTDAVKLLTLAHGHVWIPGGHVIVNVDGLPTILLLGITRLCVASFPSITKMGRGFNPDVTWRDS